MAYRNGMDVKFTKPNEFKSLKCEICGAVMTVKRGVVGPTSYAEAMSIRFNSKLKGHLHDTFYCPNSDKPWHDKAGELLNEIENTTSSSLKKIIRKDYKTVIKKKEELC